MQLIQNDNFHFSFPSVQKTCWSRSPNVCRSVENLFVPFLDNNLYSSSEMEKKNPFILGTATYQRFTLLQSQ